MPSTLLTAMLDRKMPLATAIGTEKAKSEMIVAGVLVELREKLEHRISLFSGIDFNVDAEADMIERSETSDEIFNQFQTTAETPGAEPYEKTGSCDFVISLSPVQFSLEAPVIVRVEARNDNLEIGLGQCVAEMVAS